MVIILESNNSEAIQAITAMAKALKVDFKVESDTSVVSKSEIQRRAKALKPFKGALKQYTEGNYQPNKHDWYQQCGVKANDCKIRCWAESD